MKLPETQRVADLLSSLSASISTVQFSRGRWSAVQSTASRLSLSLSSLSLSSTPSPLLTELLSSLSQTITLTLDLSNESQSPDPKNGKLRTQSDIAAAAAALDRIAADLELLLSSPASLTESSGFKNLVTRLQIGGPSSRIAALDSLISEDDKSLKLAVDHNAVGAIVRLLDSYETRERAVAAIARVSAVEGCRDAVMAESATILNQLARILESDSGFSKENACVALKYLTLVKDNAVLISSRGGISSLLQICGSGTPSAVAAAAGVLINIAGVEELRQMFLEDNAVEILIGVLKSGTVRAQENSMGCLCNLAAGEDDPALKIAIFKEGALDCMLNYMEGGRDLQPAIGLLRNLASLNYVAEVIQLSEMFVKVILALDSSRPSTRAEAARAISEFSGKLRKEIEDAVPRLVRMLEAKTSGEKMAAVKALASILKGSSGARRVFRKEEKGIVNSVMLLDPFVTDVEKKFSVEVLLSVSQSRKCRRQMVALGACVFLKRLVGMEVEGAKRLLECLERGKFWGVFPRN